MAVENTNPVGFLEHILTAYLEPCVCGKEVAEARLSSVHDPHEPGGLV